MRDMEWVETLGGDRSWFSVYSMSDLLYSDSCLIYKPAIVLHGLCFRCKDLNLWCSSPDSFLSDHRNAYTLRGRKIGTDVSFSGFASQMATKVVSGAGNSPSR